MDRKICQSIFTALLWRLVALQNKLNYRLTFMLKSIWRSSHLCIGLIAASFIFISAVTGSFLAFEPIVYKQSSLNEVQLSVNLSSLLKTLDTRYEEVYQITKTKANHLVADVLDFKGATKTIYLDPITGNSLGFVPKKHQFFKTIRAFHRSLFLKKTGRIVMLATSIALLLMLLSGFLLLIDRYGNFFSILNKEKSYKQWGSWHSILSKYFWFPLVLITITGLHLSFDTLGILDTSTPKSFKKKPPNTESNNVLDRLLLSEVTTITFPFSTDASDYYTIQTNSIILDINQYSKEIISSEQVKKSLLPSAWSYRWHTGEGNIWWAIILVLSSIAILFLVITGTVLGYKRLKTVRKRKNKHSIDTCKLNIFVGSQNGNTWLFAKAFYKQLENLEIKVGLWPLEEFQVYENTKQIIILTSTYGDGDPPVKVTGLQEKIQLAKPAQTILYHVVGFGSKAYPKYCAFAKAIDQWLGEHAYFTRAATLVKINEQNESDFNKWSTQWGKMNSIVIRDVFPNMLSNKKENTFEVVFKSALNDATFLLSLKPIGKIDCKSGDTIAIEALKNSNPRYYSIAVVDGLIVLSIKKHEKGLCSNYLFDLKLGDILKGVIKENNDFHFNKKAQKVIMIANGTGIAPFLGMIANNVNTNITLIWGGKTRASFELYRELLENQLQSKKLETIYTCFSREDQQCYVQDIIDDHKTILTETLNKKGEILICGSLKMQQGVEERLQHIVETGTSITSIITLKELHQIKTDCY